MKQFEYFLYETTDSIEFQRQALHEFGSIGWELVSVIREKPSSSVGYTYYFFKREILNGSTI